MAFNAATNGHQSVTILVDGDSITDDTGAAGKWLDYVIAYYAFRYNNVTQHWRDIASSGKAIIFAPTFAQEFGGGNYYNSSNDGLGKHDEYGAFFKADVVMEFMTINNGTLTTNEYRTSLEYMLTNRWLYNGAMGTNVIPGLPVGRNATNYNGASLVMLIGCNPQENTEGGFYGKILSYGRSLMNVSVASAHPGTLSFDMFGFLRGPYSNNYAGVVDNALGTDQYNLQWWTPHSGPAGQLTYAWANLSQLLNELTGTNIVASWANVDAVNGVSAATNCTINILSHSSTGVQFTRTNVYESGYTFDGYGTIGSYFADTAYLNGHGVGDNATGAIGMFPGIQTSNQVVFIVSNLSAGSYYFYVDGTNVGTYSAAQLQTGVNANTWTNGAYVDQGFNALNQVRYMRGCWTTNGTGSELGGFKASSGGSSFGNVKTKGKLAQQFQLGLVNDELVNNPLVIALENLNRTNSTNSDFALQSATIPRIHTFTISLAGAPPAQSAIPLMISGSVSGKGTVTFSH